MNRWVGWGREVGRRTLEVAIDVGQSVFLLALRSARGAHRLLRAIEPWGVVFGLIGVVVALITLVVDLGDRQSERVFRAWQIVRQAENDSEQADAIVGTSAISTMPRGAFGGGSSLRRALEYLNLQSGGVLCWAEEGPNIYRGCLVPGKQRESLYRLQARRTDLSDAHLPDAILISANISNSLLERAHLVGASLQQAKLREANLAGAELVDADFSRADLAGATLTGADLTDANLTSATLTEATLWMTNLTEANLTRANLTSADLTDADLTDAHLGSGGLLDGENPDPDPLAFILEVWGITENPAIADMFSADDDVGADLTRANLAGANLTRVDLTDANLLDARGITQEQLDAACGDGSPRNLPSPLTWTPRACPTRGSLP